MIKVTVLYPLIEDGHFDMEYYLQCHIPMVEERMGDALIRVSVEEGIAGAAPGSPASFVAIGHLYFESVEDFQHAFGPHADVILCDMPNYTNVRPTIQISTLRL
ncbi:MAG: EthD family reductase [Motiliproteus sp.]|nr:EthD family reductase [Motiliproteus sp.]MCW9050731.1 EthD family reductase [Motiliproteus sp.]